MTALRVGTRASQLALVQSEGVAKALGDLGAATTLVEISTHGDVSVRPLAELGGTGVFTSALREELLAGTIDVAVHSYKDLPTVPADGVVVAAVPVREDPRDVLVASGGRTLLELPAGARVGTGAPRRVAQLRRIRPDLDYVDVRGNVDTRLRKLADGEFDAIVLARAGLARLGRLEAVTQVLGELLPAPAQGALAIECRAGDTDLVALLGQLDDPASRAAAGAERAVLARLEAGCSAPLGALAECAAGEPGEPAELYVRAVVVAVDGTAAVTRSATGPMEDSDTVGRRLADELLEAGAAQLLGSTT